MTANRRRIHRELGTLVALGILAVVVVGVLLVSLSPPTAGDPPPTTDTLPPASYDCQVVTTL